MWMSHYQINSISKRLRTASDANAIPQLTLDIIECSPHSASDTVELIVG